MSRVPCNLGCRQRGRRPACSRTGTRLRRCRRNSSPSRCSTPSTGSPRTEEIPPRAAARGDRRRTSGCRLGRDRRGLRRPAPRRQAGCCFRSSDRPTCPATSDTPPRTSFWPRPRSCQPEWRVTGRACGEIVINYCFGMGSWAEAQRDDVAALLAAKDAATPRRCSALTLARGPLSAGALATVLGWTAERTSDAIDFTTDYPDDYPDLTGRSPCPEPRTARTPAPRGSTSSPSPGAGTWTRPPTPTPSRRTYRATARAHVRPRGEKSRWRTKLRAEYDDPSRSAYCTAPTPATPSMATLDHPVSR